MASFWTALGLTVPQVQAASAAYWLTYEPSLDDRTQVLKNIFGAVPLRDAMLREALHDNAMKIIAQLDAKPGGVVVLAHKLGSKSQTLSYLEGLCRTLCTNHNIRNFFFLRVSLKDSLAPIRNWRDLFSRLNDGIMAGLLPLCLAYLKAELQTELGAVAAPDFPNPLYDRFHNRKTVAQYVYDLLKQYYATLDEEKAVGNKLSKENVCAFYHSLCKVLSNPTQTICRSLIMIDEAGEGLNPKLGKYPDRQAIYQALIDPLEDSIAEQAVGTLKFSVVLCGSTSMSKLRHDYVNRFCRLSPFSAVQCNALWELWKAQLPPAKKISAETWLGDLAKTTEASFGEALKHHTDGIPGCLVELFCEALDLKPAKTLAQMVKEHYANMCAEFFSTKGGLAVHHVVTAMEQKNWEAFANNGLSQAPTDAPCGPVLRILFDLLRKEDFDDDYGKMLQAMSSLSLSGSFDGAVFEEKVRYHLLCGLGVRASVISPKIVEKGKKKTKTVEGWEEQDAKTMFDSSAMLVSYEGKEFSEPKQFSPGVRAIARKTKPSAPEPDKFILFVPQSQTFPSIDMSIAHIVTTKDKKGKDKTSTRVDVFHISVSISVHHFATFNAGTWSKSGHLPLDLAATPPSILRSAKAYNQLAVFRDALEKWDQFPEGAKFNHCYGLVDDAATDLFSLPTDVFQKPFYRFRLA